MSPQIVTVLAATRRFPRVSGDEPAAITRVVRVIRFSPRERG